MKLSIALLFGILLIIALTMGPDLLRHEDSVVVKKTVFERIFKTRTLRCGYKIQSPFVFEDSSAGGIGGVFYDIVTQMGHELDMKIEWTAEIDGGVDRGFSEDKYDLFCAPFVPEDGEKALPTKAIYNRVDYVWVRADDGRFDVNLEGLNEPEVKILVKGGSLQERIAREKFPKAMLVMSAPADGYMQILSRVRYHTADAAIFDMSHGDAFLAGDPGSLKRAGGGKSVAVSPVTLAVPKGEIEFKGLIDGALRRLAATGVIASSFRKYAPNEEFHLNGEGL